MMRPRLGRQLELERFGTPSLHNPSTAWHWQSLALAASVTTATIPASGPSPNKFLDCHGAPSLVRSLSTSITILFWLIGSGSQDAAGYPTIEAPSLEVREINSLTTCQVICQPLEDKSLEESDRESVTRRHWHSRRYPRDNMNGREQQILMRL